MSGGRGQYSESWGGELFSPIPVQLYQRKASRGLNYRFAWVPSEEKSVYPPSGTYFSRTRVFYLLTVSTHTISSYLPICFDILATFRTYNFS